MGKALEIEDDVTVEALRRAARAETGGRAAARMYAIAGALDGLSRAEAARLAGMERQALRDAVLRYNAEGLAGAAGPAEGTAEAAPERGAGGRACRGDPARPRSGGGRGLRLDTGRSLRVARGASWQDLPPFEHDAGAATDGLLARDRRGLPMPRAGPRGAGAPQKGRLAERVAAAATEHPDKRVELWFEDEARVGNRGRVCHRWWRRGERPPGARQLGYRWAYIFTAIRLAMGEDVTLVLPAVNAEAMQVFLDHVAASRPPDAHVVMVLDGAGWHLSRDLAVPANITLVVLPPYSPELNPVERVWLYLRERFLSLRLLPLEFLTKPSDLVEADERTGERGEGPVDVGATLVADREPSEAGEPGQRALDHPAVSPEAVGALDARAARCGERRTARGIRPGSGGGRRPCRRGACGAGSGAVPGRGARRARHRGPRRASCCHGGSRRSARSQAACRGHRRRGGASCPVARGRWGSGRSSSQATSAPFCGDGRAVDRRPALVELVGRGQPLEQHPVQLAQHAGGMPVAQPAPARHTCAAERLARQPLPADARPQDEHDALKGPSVAASRAPALRLGGSGGSSGATAAHSSSLIGRPLPDAGRGGRLGRRWSRAAVAIASVARPSRALVRPAARRRPEGRDGLQEDAPWAAPQSAGQ